MESFESKSIAREPNFEENQTLLYGSFVSLAKTLSEHSTKENPYSATVSATTDEAEKQEKVGRLTIEQNHTQLSITLTETRYTNKVTEPNTTERYILSLDKTTPSYILQATGKHPNVIDNSVTNFPAGEEDEFGVPTVDLGQEFHLATPEETRRFADIVALGAFDDFKSFEAEYEQLLSEFDQ